MTKEEQIFLNQLGERIQTARKKMEMTQEGLAKYAGISVRQLIRIEKGLQPTNVIVVYRIARELNIPINDLMD
jgi:transcriptional regulator with XRE-family HTH domain